MDVEEHFRRCWSSNKHHIEDELIKEHPDLAFVYALPFMKDPPQEVIDWAQSNFHSWIRPFRVHFRPDAGKTDKPIRRIKNREEANEEDIESFKTGSDPLYWRNMQPYSIEAFQFCLFKMEKIEKAEQLACILPPVLQLAEDHEMAARIAGTTCLTHLLEKSPSLVVRMGLIELVLQILKTNLSFMESATLLDKTIFCLETLINNAVDWKVRRFSPEYFEVLDDFMEAVLRGLAVAKPSEENFDTLISGLERIVRLEQLGAVRVVRDLLLLIAELSQSYHGEPLRRLYETVKRVCAPRLMRYNDLMAQIDRQLS